MNFKVSLFYKGYSRDKGYLINDFISLCLLFRRRSTVNVFVCLLVLDLCTDSGVHQSTSSDYKTVSRLNTSGQSLPDTTTTEVGLFLVPVVQSKLRSYSPFSTLSKTFYPHTMESRNEIPSPFENSRHWTTSEHLSLTDYRELKHVNSLDFHFLLTFRNFWTMVNHPRWRVVVVKARRTTIFILFVVQHQ